MHTLESPSMHAHFRHIKTIPCYNSIHGIQKVKKDMEEAYGGKRDRQRVSWLPCSIHTFIVRKTAWAAIV